MPSRYQAPGRSLLRITPPLPPTFFTCFLTQLHRVESCKGFYAFSFFRILGSGFDLVPVLFSHLFSSRGFVRFVWCAYIYIYTYIYIYISYVHVHVHVLHWCVAWFLALRPPIEEATFARVHPSPTSPGWGQSDFAEIFWHARKARLVARSMLLLQSWC